MIGDGTQLQIKRTGTVIIPTDMGYVKIPNVLHVPRDYIKIFCLLDV